MYRMNMIYLPINKATLGRRFKYQEHFFSAFLQPCPGVLTTIYHLSEPEQKPAIKALAERLVGKRRGIEGSLYTIK